jgi:GntR family transcriptional regulator, transcriptional repressor for pyruvate dehydrogenase complex
VKDHFEGEMVVVRPAMSYELVVDQIRRAIQLGRFGPGDKLPSERELSQQLGVSRTTLRGAMRVLQGEGLIEITRGRTGGAVVTAPPLSEAEAKRYLRDRLAELEETIEFRLIVEPPAARLAAERRRKRDIPGLRELLREMTEVAAAASSISSPLSPFFALDSEFHNRIAAAARNQMLISAVTDARSALYTPTGSVFPALHPSSNDLHNEILQSIEVQDPTAAEDAMRRHILLTRTALREVSRGPTRTRRAPPT